MTEVLTWKQFKELVDAKLVELGKDENILVFRIDVDDGAKPNKFKVIIGQEDDLIVEDKRPWMFPRISIDIPKGV